MAFYKVPVKGKLNIISVDISPLIEDRVVYSAFAEGTSWERRGTGGFYVFLAGGVKHSGEPSDAIDVYKFSRNRAVHVASGRLNTPAERPHISKHNLGFFGWYNIGAEKWALDMPGFEHEVFHRLNDQDLVNRER